MDNDFTVNNFILALGISRPTIYRMIKSGELTAYKIRRSTRIPFSELARIKGSNKISPPTQINYNSSSYVYLDCCDYKVTDLIKELTDQVEIYGENVLCSNSYDKLTKDNILYFHLPTNKDSCQ